MIDFINAIDPYYMERAIYLLFGAAFIAALVQVSLDAAGYIRRRKGPKNAC
jgi:hypothetical protein